MTHFNIKDDSEIELFLENYNINNDLEELQVKYGFDVKLNTLRNKIDLIEPNTWKCCRWEINQYDFLVKDPIINRAFYKYWEIVNEFDIFENFTENDIIYHCAEAPGGFIQGSNIFLQLDSLIKTPENNYKSDIDSDGFTIVKKNKREPRKYKIFTISLNKDLPQYKSYNLPSYNKSIINKHVYITYGKDNTGDINNVENVYYIKNLINKQQSEGCYLITSDLGFDEGNEFNNKEQLHCSAITNCILNAVILQNDNGNYILKVFDIFTETSVQLLYLLNTLYKEIYVYKPKTSRPSNSEKYIICKGFNCNPEYKDKVITILTELSNTFKKNTQKYVSFKLFEKIPDSFVEKFKKMNTELLNLQCQFLERAIDLCLSPDFMKNYEKTLQSSLEKRKQIFKQWETLYNLNVFI
jgi:23S rRNA U2552 (ribose-2'-O)-methylase RlmE/FtsJ